MWSAVVCKCTQRLQADGVTIQHCYLEIKNLIAELNAICSPLQAAARTLACLLNARFDYYYNGHSAYFDPIYLVVYEH